jgi:NTE family protein/lysophospholipid hydrolase
MPEDERSNLGLSSQSGQEPVRAEELREILSSYKPFSGLTDETLEALAGISERVLVTAGQRVQAEGMTVEGVFIVELGRVRAIARFGQKILSEDAGRGEIFNWVPALTKEPGQADVFALRDCTLIRLQIEGLQRCLAMHPELIAASYRAIRDIFWRTHGVRSTDSRPQTFAFLPVSDDPRIREAADSLLQALSKTVGPGLLVDRDRLEEIMGRKPSEADELERRRLIAWFGEQEAAGRFLLFVCDPTETRWTRWCLEQTDRIVVASRPETTSEIERIDRTFAGRSVAGSPVQVDLVLIHEQETELPRGTRPWVDLRCLGRHHQVRRGNTADVERAARRMSGRAVGVVLGGGGARALAHIGALQALEEAGIRVDVIGGTSMGSVMAAAHAMGWPPKRMLETMKQVVPNSKALTDVDFPMVSFLAGRKLRGILEFAFAGVDIVDLWLPYYCISASLNEARMVVHERGPLARSVRASCSLPGIYPPVRAEGQFLVDGGIMNNIPVDIMDGMCRGGTVIAIDVGGGGARNLELGRGTDPHVVHHAERHAIRQAAHRRRLRGSVPKTACAGVRAPRLRRPRKALRDRLRIHAQAARRVGWPSAGDNRKQQ